MKRDDIILLMSAVFLLSLLVPEPWNIIIGGTILMPFSVYLIWDIIENRNK